MIKYTVNWEEFQEFYLTTRPEARSRQSYVSFTAAIFIAMATVVFGLWLTQLAPPENRTKVALIFISLSAGVVALAFWDKTWTGRKKKQPTEEMRSVFESEYSGPQSFSFDHERWILETQTGRQETLWTGLMMAWELQNTIALWAKNNFVLLPKRVLSGEETDSLRRLAFASGGKVTQFHVSIADFVLTEAPSFWRRNPLTPVFYVAVLTFGFFVFKTAAEKGSHFVWSTVLSAVIVFVMHPFYLVVQYMTKATRVSWEGEFCDRGAQVKTPKGKYFTAWTQFKKFRETRRCFLLHFAADEYFLIAKRCLSTHEQASLRQLLKAKLPEE